MCIRHLEQIFSVDIVVPIDLLPVFQQILCITLLFYPGAFYRSHKFPYLSLLLSTTILNDTVLEKTSMINK